MKVLHDTLKINIQPCIRAITSTALELPVARATASFVHVTHGY